MLGMVVAVLGNSTSGLEFQHVLREVVAVLIKVVAALAVVLNLVLPEYNLEWSTDLADLGMFIQTWLTWVCLYRLGRLGYVYTDLADLGMFIQTWQTWVCLYRLGRLGYVYTDLADLGMFIQTWQTWVCLYRLG